MPFTLKTLLEYSKDERDFIGMVCTAIAWPAVQEGFSGNFPESWNAIVCQTRFACEEHERHLEVVINASTGLFVSLMRSEVKFDRTEDFRSRCFDTARFIAIRKQRAIKQVIDANPPCPVYWNENWPLSIVQAPRSEDDDFRDLVCKFKVSIRGWASKNPDLRQHPKGPA
jgi:hypothetical protein